ncbi:MAG: sigma 54-interacting transcriptional regulator, partial [Rubrivivax sp.]
MSPAVDEAKPRSAAPEGELPVVLIAEDDRHMRELIGLVLRGSQLRFELVAVENAVAAMDVIEDREVALLITDLCMPGADGLDLLRFTKARQRLCQVLLVTGFATVDSAVAALKDGAFDYVQKPFDTDRLRALAEAALQYHLALAEAARLRRAARPGAPGVADGPDAPAELIGRSAALARVQHMIEAAAAYDAGVLVTGESGCGKELVVQRIHQSGARRDRPFVAINCAAIPDTLIESELFGYRRGAFTGA